MKLRAKHVCRLYYLREDTSTRKIDMSEKKEMKYLKKVADDNAGELYTTNLMRQLGDVRVEDKAAKIIQSVLNLRSDNHVMRASVAMCLQVWEISKVKKYGTLLDNVFKILQMNDQHSRPSLKIEGNHEQTSVIEPRKKHGFKLSKLWKRWTPDDQIQYKKKVDTSGKDTIIYDPTMDGEFKDWIGFTPSQIRKQDGIKAVRVIRPGLSKKEVKPRSDKELEKVVKEFKKERAKGDEKITVTFLKRLGKKHGFTTGQYHLKDKPMPLKIIISPILQESGWLWYMNAMLTRYGRI